MNRGSRVVAALFVAPSIALGACGGGSDSAGAKPLTKQAYIERADALCDAANKKLDALPEPQSLQELSTTFKTGIDTITTLLAEIRRAEPPADDRNTVEGIYRMVESGIAKFREALQAVAAGDAAEAQTAATEAEDLLDQANQASAAYGFDECSK